MEASHSLPALEKSFNLIGETPRSGMVVIIEMGNYLARSALASVVPLLSNLRSGGQMDQPDSWIVLRHQMPYVLAVREYE